MDDRRVVVITGAARRVGRATALAFARVGCDLELTYHTSEAEMASTASDCVGAARDAGHEIRVAVHRLDLGDASAVERIGRTIGESSATSGVAGLVHNASSYSAGAFGEIAERDALHEFRVNAVAPLLLTQALAPALTRAGGAVVVYGDIHAEGRPRRGFAAYAMSKAAATSLVHSLAVELAPKVRVNGIAPGVIAWPEGTDPREIASYESRIPLARSGTPEDAAAVATWLILEAPYVTGEVLRLDGGRWLR